MKNIVRYLFIIICIIICILPFAGMAVHPTNETTENRIMSVFPDFRNENGGININFMQELGTYFNDHFAFRLALVSADAEIQSNLFGVSNADSVIAGDNGWLYYASTTDDYLGKNTMTERGIKNIAHNLQLLQEYAESNGAKFIFTVPPNKNTLYGQDMPYYLKQKVSNVKNIGMLKSEMQTYNISYCDLFSLFQNQKEVLYLKRDSHWNNKGAVLAYHAMLDQAGIRHDDYKGVRAIRTKTEYGDLGRMLYPVGAEPDWNYYYEKEHAFSYVTDTESVEDAWIETENRQGTGKLLMFRDSFGNTLLPLMADTFSEGYFSKGVPQNVAGYMNSYHPDVVILEKVERNIKELTTDPPLVEGAVIDLGKAIETTDSETSIEIKECENNSSYLEVSGNLDQSLCSKNTEIYIMVSGRKKQDFYKALYVSDQASDYGYKLYLLKEDVPAGELSFDVVIEKDGQLRSVKSLTYRK